MNITSTCKVCNRTLHHTKSTRDEVIASHFASRHPAEYDVAHGYAVAVNELLAKLDDLTDTHCRYFFLMSRESMGK